MTTLADSFEKLPVTVLKTQLGRKIMHGLERAQLAQVRKYMARRKPKVNVRTAAAG